AEEGSVETVPELRRRGYGRTALGAWARSVLTREKTPFVRRASTNVAARELLRSVGASEFADSIALP
ncbi:MAG TPA: GNAT family N-acetyltransferase, partial [Thermoplasmata archaeon]|nr:GNAT family N-acetyltransferase [Thermoplasmata archaeon]